MNEEKEKEIETYNEFNNVDGGEIGTKSRDAEIETAGKELFGLFLRHYIGVFGNEWTFLSLNWSAEIIPGMSACLG